jgi:hypothetical protein
MFTIPDEADAATSCPPLSPVGPHPNGFFQNCGGRAGTIPSAEHFNELILNLHALLAHAGVAGVKGDPTMLWRCIDGMIRGLVSVLVPPMIPPPIPQTIYTIDSGVTIYVAPGGSPWPGNPFAGNPFDNLASAFHWLGFYSITEYGYVTIQLSIATYNHAAQINLNHPNGDRITIAGGDMNGTVLNFYNNTNGIVVNSRINVLTNLTVQGTHANGTTGVLVDGGWLGIDVAQVLNFDVLVQSTRGGFLYFNSLLIQGGTTAGLAVFQGGSANGQELVVNFMGYLIGAPFYAAAVNCTAGGTVWVDRLFTTNVHKGVDVSGAGSELRARVINIGGSEVDTAVEANDGGCIISNGGNPGDWYTGNGYFWANNFGFIRADNSFTPATRAAVSPPAQTIGNVNAMVWAN